MKCLQAVSAMSGRKCLNESDLRTGCESGQPSLVYITDTMRRNIECIYFLNRMG